MSQPRGVGIGTNMSSCPAGLVRGPVEFDLDLVSSSGLVRWWCTGPVARLPEATVTQNLIDHQPTAGGRWQPLDNPVKLYHNTGTVVLSARRAPGCTYRSRCRMEFRSIVRS